METWHWVCKVYLRHGGEGLRGRQAKNGARGRVGATETHQLKAVCSLVRAAGLFALAAGTVGFFWACGRPGNGMHK